MKTYLAKNFLRTNAFCDHEAKLVPQVTDTALTFAGDPMDAEPFNLSMLWSLTDKGFQFKVADTTRCTVFGPAGALAVGDSINWSPNDFDGDRIRFTIKIK